LARLTLKKDISREACEGSREVVLKKERRREVGEAGAEEGEKKRGWRGWC
jgi:hypothetical protein